MRMLRLIFHPLALCLLLILACAPLSVLPSGKPAPSQVAAVETATLVTVPTEAPATATLQPVVLSGPPMKVGSMWPYVDGSVIVAVPSGDFTMGHGGSDNPEHVVTLSDYWIYQGKVTNQQYALCVQAGDCTPPDSIDDFTFGDVTHSNDPVVGVTYAQATDYCTFVHGRLPTEAEWEKAARGPDGNLYPWGNGDPSCDYLNYNNCVGKITDTTKYPQGQSYYHALDMEGNVFEWVADWYDALYYKNSASEDPPGPEKGLQRSVRSSNYRSKIDQTPASTRFFDFPKDHRRDLGFRCVVEDPTYFAPLCESIGLIGSGPSGGSNPGSLGVDCPKLSVGLNPVCQQGKVQVFVNDSYGQDDQAHVSWTGNCSGPPPSNHQFPQVYDCFNDGTFTIQSQCSYQVNSPAQCISPYYNLNTSTGMCEWDGTGTQGGQCLPGMTYDPVNQCCSAQPGSGMNYAVCPLGTALGYVNGQPVCVPNGQALNQPSASDYIHVQDASTCTGNPGGGCSLTSCPRGQYLGTDCQCHTTIQ